MPRSHIKGATRAWIVYRLLSSNCVLSYTEIFVVPLHLNVSRDGFQSVLQLLLGNFANDLFPDLLLSECPLGVNSVDHKTIWLVLDFADVSWRERKYFFAHFGRKFAPAQGFHLGGG